MAAEVESPEDARAQARQTYRQSQAAEMPLTGKALGEMFGKSDRWGRMVIADVRNEQQPDGDESATALLPKIGNGNGRFPPEERNAETEAESTGDLPRNAERKPERDAEMPPEAEAERRNGSGNGKRPERQRVRQRGSASAAAAADRPERPKVKGAGGFYFVAVMALGVSVDTSFRFFGERLGIHGAEQIALFAVIEAALIACGWGMAQGVRARRGPGPYRVTAWALCGASAYAAVDLAGPIAGAARAVLGPVLGLVMLHHALGIDRKASGGEHNGLFARVGRELRERLLSRLGLADEGRLAIERTKARAARRAAHLANAGGWVPFRTSRLNRALRAADVAHDERQRQRMLAELRTLQHAESLRNLKQVTPWEAETVVAAEVEAGTEIGR